MLVSDVGAGDISSTVGDTLRGAKIWLSLKLSKRLWRRPLGLGLIAVDSVQLLIHKRDCGFTNAESRETQTRSVCVCVLKRRGGEGETK